MRLSCWGMLGCAIDCTEEFKRSCHSKPKPKIIILSRMLLVLSHPLGKFEVGYQMKRLPLQYEHRDFIAFPYSEL